jgi:hypothetical protein
MVIEKPESIIRTLWNIKPKSGFDIFLPQPLREKIFH